MAKKPNGELINGEKREKMVKMACDWNRGQYWQNTLLEDL